MAPRSSPQLRNYFAFLWVFISWNAVSCVTILGPFKETGPPSFLTFANTTQLGGAAHNFVNTFERQVEYELHFSSHRDQIPTVNKVELVLLACAFHLCGCHRCYLGLYITGCCQFLTLGGFMIWGIIDYAIILSNCFEEGDELDLLGMHAKFHKSSISMAYYIAVFLLVMHLFNCLMSCSTPERRQNSMQSTLKRVPAGTFRRLRQGGLLPARPSLQELKALFSHIDTDGDGQLDKSELQKGLVSIGCNEDDIEAMIKEADQDGDGRINFQEFIMAVAREGADDSKA